MCNNPLRYTVAAGVALAVPTSYAVADVPTGSEAPVENDEMVVAGDLVHCDVDIEADALFAEPLVLSDVQLPVVKPPKVKLCNFTKISIPAWGVSVDVAQDALYQLRRAAMRRISVLQRHVKMAIQTDEERRTWHSVLDAVDYSYYSAYDMPYRWTMGLLEKKGVDVRVRWDEGEGGLETLASNLVQKFELVDEGETFVARVKTIHYRTVDIDRISIVSRERSDEDDLSWIA